MRIPTERARKRRTIPKDELALALDGRLEHVYGYSFLLTNLPVATDEQLAELEWWYRHRTDIEALNKDAELGAAPRHLPSANHAVNSVCANHAFNSVWMWAALLACALSSWIQEITGLDRGNSRGRRTVPRLRRELINIPAQLTRRAGTLLLRLPPGPQLLATVLTRLQQLPTPTEPFTSCPRSSTKQECGRNPRHPARQPAIRPRHQTSTPSRPRSNSGTGTRRPYSRILT